MKLVKFKCMDCKTVFVADNTHHHMDYCPNCDKSAVDLEDHYCRMIGNVKFVEAFEPPWFDDDDEYHSALLSWLINSDEDYKLEKDKKTLTLTIFRL